MADNHQAEKLREKVAELERVNARLLASLLSATESTHADWPALTLNWDTARQDA